MLCLCCFIRFAVCLQKGRCGFFRMKEPVNRLCPALFLRSAPQYIVLFPPFFAVFRICQTLPESGEKFLQFSQTFFQKIVDIHQSIWYDTGACIGQSMGIAMPSCNLTICDDVGGGCPSRQGISTEYVRFQTGRTIFHLLPLSCVRHLSKRLWGGLCFYALFAGNTQFPAFKRQIKKHPAGFAQKHIVTRCPPNFIRRRTINGS